MAEPTGYPGAPRWVKVFGIVALVVLLLFIHRLFTAGMEHGQRPSHGPGPDAPSGATDGHASSGGGHR